MKTALITGANRGLGLALCEYYLKENYIVIACCRNIEHAYQLQKLQSHTNNHLNIEQLDVCKIDSIQNLKNRLSGYPLDILINNAGIYSVDKYPYQSSDNPWELIFRTNTIGPYLITHALKENLQLGQEKKIINISSYMGSIALNNNAIECPYRASKAALNAISKNLAIELQADGMLCVSIDPGWVKTDMGGPDGLLAPAESAAHIAKTIRNLRIEQSGGFYRYDGDSMPW